MKPISSQAFQKLVKEFYRKNRRDMPWRMSEPSGAFDPYKIMVSEVMLQQTQVIRVIPKYYEFLSKFPNIEALAAAPLAAVLVAWSGLGYNRRAKYLWEAAQLVVQEYGGEMPHQLDVLRKLPGIGYNTAAAICAYAYDQPVSYIETNIRTVYIHHYFDDRIGISDKDILAVVAQTLPKKNYCEWYWALMDYGSYIKSSIGNKNTQAKIYTKQSKFKGSNRDIRGQVLRLLNSGPMTFKDIELKIQDKRLRNVCIQLESEKLITNSHEIFSLGY